MPNWCFTDYTLVGSAENVKAAYDALHKVEETERPGPFDPWNFESHSNWLGYVAQDILGLPWSDVPCRGTFDALRLDTWKGKPVVKLSTETAWTTCNELLYEVADKFKLSLNFHAAEPGCMYFDKGGDDGVYTATLHYSDEEGVEYFDTVEDFLAQYGDKYGLKADAALDEVMDAVNASEDGLLAPIGDLY